MGRIALGIAYAGGAFHGWQRQASARTVQGELEAALTRVAASPITTHAAGRTDAGVHGTGQVVHFDPQVERPLRAWIRGTNAHLPDTIEVRWAQPVDADFHARFSATHRRYQYLFADAAAPAPLLRDQVWRTEVLDADAMHRAAQALLGEQDFTTLRAAGCQSHSPWRCVHRVTVSRHGALVVLDISANAFLLHMVRNTARLLHDVGQGLLTPAQLSTLLAARDRTAIGATAPPQGLYLVEVGYAGGPALPEGSPAPLLSGLGPLAQL